MKKARVIPIFKSGNKDDRTNYQPISLVPTLSKLFKCHIANQMQLFLKGTNILLVHSSQSAFRKKSLVTH